MALLECKNLSYGYIDGNRKRMILNDLSYSFEKGKFYTILGPSGSGKTTLLSLIGALEKAQEGEIDYEGKNNRRHRVRQLPQGQTSGCLSAV